ncbi:MAG: phosphatidate cytidylyltransferase [Planctomycetota bacterium]|jgi:phosphatidate cytidylyltransferase
MSPEAALQSRVFLVYLAVLAGLLLAACATIALAGWGFRRNVGHAWESFRGWMLMIPPLLGCVFLGRVPTILFFTLVALVAFREFARATGLSRDRLMSGIVYLGIAAAGGVLLATDPIEKVPGWYGLFMALPVYVIAAILMVPIVRNRTEGQLQAIALAALGFLYVGWMFGHVAYLANATHAYGYLLYLLVAVEVNDVAAYTCGKLFGRRKLASRVSPNKTWEGAVGAAAVAMALPWCLRFSFPHFGVLECVLTGLIVGIGGQLGDLSMSVIKRDVGVKDMGTAIRGHGGVLDRVDSLIYAAPLFFHMVRQFHGI